MGSKEETHKRMSSVALALGMVASLLTIALIGYGLVALGDYTKSPFRSHDAIYIEGNADLTASNGIVGGSGSASNPFVIEGWSILTNKSACITVNNTDANIIIRNVSLGGTWNRPLLGPIATGIWLDNATSVRVESCLFSSLAQGIRVNRSEGDPACSLETSACFFSLVGKPLTAENLTACSVTRSYCIGPGYDWAMSFENCTSVTFSNNTVDQAGLRAAVVKMGNSSRCIVRDNHISVWGRGYGIWAYESLAVDISHNHVDCYEDLGIVTQTCSMAHVTRNEISSGSGIWLDQSSSSYVRGNILHLDRQYAVFPWIAISNSINCAIQGNTLTRAGGIEANGCTECEVSDNYVSESGFYNGWYGSSGIWIQRCTYFTIRNNVLDDCTGQGLVASGTNVTIEGNFITGNSNNIGGSVASGSGMVASGSNLTIRYNLISNNTRHSYYQMPAVYLSYCDNSTFEYNNVSDDFQVYFCDNTAVLSNRFAAGWNLSVLSFKGRVTFTGNDFLQPLTIAVSGNASLTDWNASYPEGGNYWSSYAGADEYSGPEQNLPGLDGIGDTPYAPTIGVNDSYPLMKPMSIADVTRPITVAVVEGTLGHSTWYVSNVSVALRAFDSNGSKPFTWYSLDGGVSSPYNGTPIDITGDGIHTLVYSSVDFSQNSELAEAVEVRIDTAPPSFRKEPLPEYKFRLRASEAVFIEIDSMDNLSGGAYSYAMYNTTYFGYTYPVTVFTAGKWLSFVPPDGERDFTITVVDEAGNSRTAVGTIAASIAPITNPFDPNGPYGGWYLLGVLVDLGLVIAALEILAISRSGWVRVPKWTKRDEGQRHYDEDVVDGYPKFMKRI